MNRRLLINCAPSGTGQGSNLGMHTVDFAAHNLLQRLGLGQRGLLLRPWKPLDGELGGNTDLLQFDKWPPEFQETHGDHPVEPGDLILAWGDFQLGFDYQTQSANRFRQICEKRGKAISSGEAIDWCYRNFLMQDLLDRNDVRLGTYGSTLFQNRMADWCDDRYRPAIDKFLKRCEILRFRDPYSAWVASRIVDRSSSDLWGADAAFLNSRDELLTLEHSGYAQQVEGGAIGLYIGRSTRRTSMRGLSRFIKDLVRRLKTQLMWIPWSRFAGNGLFARKPRGLTWSLPQLNDVPQETPLMAGDIFRLIAEMQLVVTDTYHVAVNAMCLGVPVLCIYEPSPARDRDANMGYRDAWRDKRVLLYLSTNQSDLLMPSCDLKDKKRRQQKSEHIANLITQRSVIDNWRAWIEHERDQQRSWLESELRSRLMQS